MAKRRETYVGLLRGINVGGKNRIPMADLRSVCVDIHFESVETYIQSGNLVFIAAGSAVDIERRLEEAIEQAFGVTVPVIVRTASAWHRYVEGNPFPGAVKREANWVLLCLSKSAPEATAGTALQQRGTEGERVVQTGDAIWIHYANGIARSKLSPTVLDRQMASSVTTRNWRTVLKLNEMARDTATQA
jgi:uncharacterized protein (DUF1697 family)